MLCACVAWRKGLIEFRAVDAEALLAGRDVEDGCEEGKGSGERRHIRQNRLRRLQRSDLVTINYQEALNGRDGRGTIYKHNATHLV